MYKLYSKKNLLGKKVQLITATTSTGKNKETMTIQINKQTKKKKTLANHQLCTPIWYKMMWSLLWKETLVFLLSVILYILSVKFNV